MKKYVIERNVPDIGKSNASDLCGVTRRSNGVLAKLSPRLQWQESFVVADKTFSIYLAEDEAAIRERSRLSGFPADAISEVEAIIDRRRLAKTTGGMCNVDLNCAIFMSAFDAVDGSPDCGQL